MKLSSYQVKNFLFLSKDIKKMKFIKTLKFVVPLILFVINSSNQCVAFGKILFDDIEEAECKKILKSFDGSLAKLPMSELIVEVGKKFLGTEYVGGTLDKNIKSEGLIIMVTGLDCVTFVENVLVMSRLIKLNKLTFEDYKNELTKVRYRNGVIDGYPSRLHYFTDWIYDNQQKGIVSDITESIGGIPYDKRINFMSSHVNSYKQLQNNPDYLHQMELIEDNLNTRQLFYIPKQQLKSYYDNLQNGDIIATTTNIDGLDVTHTGLVFKENGRTYFMHANIKTKEVMITNDELQEYLMSNSKQTGVIVARPFEIE
ncbi:MAG: DUF1460 domain-containing protein [Chlorobiota bacterium]|nr:MAG: DUF1460 domain-containing protein [Chlorobiota bacterium]MCE7953796.1 DUF1460 domain-containing protein [Chlorobi bacterium CHB7]OQY76843.1 MAG: hypothetical protein B6D43_09490 [Ignavibacteriales bacterium UTCHB1]RIK48279.1 MAG: DUF1460 domain-containing protein [Ignavibacteriota bacterium]